MTKSMMAAVVHEFGKPLAIEEVAVPTAGPGQILVKMAATGVCHTDLHAADGDCRSSPSRRSSRAMRAWATSSPSARACGT